LRKAALELDVPLRKIRRLAQQQLKESGDGGGEREMW
jgi:hypothetical protein